MEVSGVIWLGTVAPGFGHSQLRPAVGLSQARAWPGLLQVVDVSYWGTAAGQTPVAAARVQGQGRSYALGEPVGNVVTSLGLLCAAACLFWWTPSSWAAHSACRRDIGAVPRGRNTGAMRCARSGIDIGAG